MRRKLVRAILKGQRGFTLVELLASLAIIGVLVGVVAPAVTGTQGISVDSQIFSDGSNVSAGATKFFADAKPAESRTPHTILTTTRVPRATVKGVPAQDLRSSDFEAVQVTQELSDKWPEKFITIQDVASGTVAAAPTSISNDIGAKYATVFETTAFTIAGTGAATGARVDMVALVDALGRAMDGGCFLKRLTAIDMDLLVRKRLLTAAPESATQQSGDFPNNLWLFRKTTSFGGSTDDNRDLVVLKMQSMETLEGQSVTVKDTSKARVKLTYKVTLGAVPECSSEKGVETKLAFTTQTTGSQTAGQSFNTQPVVEVQGAGGQKVATSTALVTVAITSGTGASGAVLSGTTTVIAVNGVATFSGLRIDRAGTGYTLTATSPGLASATSTAFNVQ